VGATASPRASATNPDHHLWRNNGTYFLHVTFLWRCTRKMRLRKSLQTRDVVEARRRRDRVLDRLRDDPDLTLLLR